LILENEDTENNIAVENFLDIFNI